MGDLAAAGDDIDVDVGRVGQAQVECGAVAALALCGVEAIGYPVGQARVGVVEKEYVGGVGQDGRRGADEAADDLIRAGRQGGQRVGVEGTARQPEAGSDLRSTMIIIAALLEGAAMLGLVICLLTLVLK